MLQEIQEGKAVWEMPGEKEENLMGDGTQTEDGRQMEDGTLMTLISMMSADFDHGFKRMDGMRTNREPYRRTFGRLGLYCSPWFQPARPSSHNSA